MRAVVYARVSTEHEAQINALENQLEWYKIEASRHSDWEITEVYVDQGITGTQAQKRPEFLRMMEDARKGKFDLIITREVSRFARNTVDALSYTRELKAMGVNVFFINDGINTATNDGELRLTIMSSMAQDESRKISERVKAGQKISREKHVLYGSGNILGYRRENGTYIPDPDQAETVRLIFQMYSDGEKGLTKIVNELYRLGRLDAGGHVSWDASKVSRVLHNATYKGCICYNKSHSDGYLTQKRVKNLDESSYVYVKGDFEPLVSEEMWDRCQQILLSRSARVINENGKKHKYMRNTPKSVWTAKLRCSCGAGFIQFKWRVNRDGAVVHGFQCYRRTRRPSISYLQEHGLDLGISCQIKAISEWKLDLMASKVFQNLTFDKGKTVKEVYRILNRCMAEEKTVRISRKAMLENSIAKQKEPETKVSSVKKYAKGGQIYGRSHAQGGVTFRGDNGQVFEAEGGENVYIMKKTASAEINALSALNEAHGGNSFGTSGLYKFADGGMVAGLSEANRVVKQAESMKLSNESINQLAGVVIDAVMSMPNPVVSVQDINSGQNDVSVVQGLATF